MGDSFPGKKGSERDRKGILQVQSGHEGVGRIRPKTGRGWRRQRFSGRNSVYVVTRDSFTKYTRQSRE
jgi:hypothetical protein